MFVLSFCAFHAKEPMIYYWGNALWTSHLPDAYQFPDTHSIETIVGSDEFKCLQNEDGSDTMIAQAFHLAFDGCKPSEITHSVFFDISSIRLESQASWRYAVPPMHREVLIAK